MSDSQLIECLLITPYSRYPLSHLAEVLGLSDGAGLAEYLRRKGVKVENGMVMFGVKTGEEEEVEEDQYYHDLYTRLTSYSSSDLERLILGQCWK